jgi:hypothetical protein
MKRNQLVQHLDNHGCIFKREGSGQSIYMNLKTRKDQQFRDIPKSRILYAMKFANNLGFPR